MRVIRLLALAVGLPIVLVVPQAHGGGPRYVTGPPFFTGQQGVPVGWQQTRLQYFTDPGSLSASVNHQAADALVAAAAGVWNLPVANITISQGGELAEHVSAQNTYMGANGLVFPTDVMSTNATAIPIAVIYDSDGSVTETLLGAGSSDPTECRQNAVTESVDAFDPAGYILHAVIVVNGRCTGAAPQLQLQLQYQLERVFGRVLGLAWSQTNDNVFTGTPQPTYAQELNWPIMHPIDIICGTYTYQCLANPLQLRPDDVAAMVAVYPVTQGTQGKQMSLSQAAALSGVINFPTGDGMAGVNLLIKRQTLGGVSDGWTETSVVTGVGFRRAGAAPFVAAGTDALSSMGSTDPGSMGYYSAAYIPKEGNDPGLNLLLTLESVNPLYSGSHSLGPYSPGNVAVSGTQLSPTPLAFVQPGGFSWDVVSIGDAASTCGNGGDGTASSPMEAPATGWWNGLLCGYGHVSYVAVDVKPGRTFTVEVTALDAQGYATTTKAMPVIGVFAPSDGATPSVALAPIAFQAWGFGTTTVSASTAQMSSVRIAIADQRGDGRPDFAYQARMFYADSVTPSTIPTAGATVTISGMGFRAGNAVSINGVQVSVLSWTSSVVVVQAPARSVVGASDKAAVDVVIWDKTTGATSTMTAALTYDSGAGLPNAMRLVSVPTAAVFVGATAPVAFSVQVVASDGVTPVVGDTVVFSAVGAQFGSCGAASCSLVTDANGMASQNIVPTAAGTATLQANDGTLQQSGSFLAQAQPGAIVIESAPTGSVNVGTVAQNPLQIHVQNANGNSMPNEAVTLSVPVGGVMFSACSAPVCTVMTDGGGNVGTWVTPTSMGAITIQASVGSVAQAASFTGASNVDVMRVVSTPNATVFPYQSPGNFTIALVHPDGTPDYDEPVTFTAPAGMIFQACGSNVCVLTAFSGTVGVQVPWMANAGTYTIRAAFGSVFQTVTFTVQNHSTQLNLISAPANNAVPYVSSAIPFTLQLMQDGTTPVAGAQVQVTGVLGDVTYDACTERACTLTTDANGMVSTTVTPLTAGTVVLNAVYSAVSVTASFTVKGVPDSLLVVEQPGPAGLVVRATQVLMVQLIGADGVTPLDWQRLYFTVVSGPFAFTSCTESSCLAVTCCGGYTGITGIAYGAGPVTVQVEYNGITKLIQFTAVALPDVLKMVSGPASGGYAGQTQLVPFAVQALFNDGVTPVSGRSVTVSVTNGQAGLVACAGAASCVLTADANGMVSTLVTPLAGGLITVMATDGGVSVSSSFTALAAVPPNRYTLTTPNQTVYVAEGATVPITLRALAMENGSASAEQTVHWSNSSGFALAATDTLTDGSGATSVQAWLGPLAGGIQATATACAWTNVCVPFNANGVASADMQAVFVSGAQQAATGGAAFTSVTAEVVDGSGHPVVGAAVSVYQTVSALVVCPVQGRCPAAPVLASKVTVMESAADGTITFVPLSLSGVATSTEIAVAVGTQGFATAVLTSQP